MVCVAFFLHIGTREHHPCVVLVVVMRIERGMMCRCSVGHEAMTSLAFFADA
jgi:hypothetical protein